MKQVRVTEMRLNKSYGKVCISEHLFGPLPSKNDLKEMPYHYRFYFLFNDAVNCKDHIDLLVDE
jgi:hypothetical protein